MTRLEVHFVLLQFSRVFCKVNHMELEILEGEHTLSSFHTIAVARIFKADVVVARNKVEEAWVLLSFLSVGLRSSVACRKFGKRVEYRRCINLQYAKVAIIRTLVEGVAVPRHDAEFALGDGEMEGHF